MKKLITINNDDDDDGDVFSMIQELCSEEAVNALLDAVGGCRVRIPTLESFSEESELSRVVGYKVAKEIMAAVGLGEIPARISVPSRTRYRLEQLCKQDGLSANLIAFKTGVTMRSVYRTRAELRKKGVKLGAPCRRRPIRHGGSFDDVPGVSVVRQLLLEGHKPSFLREIMNIPPEVIAWVRADLLKQGKLK